jgi:hypothetical protein
VGLGDDWRNFNKRASRHSTSTDSDFSEDHWQQDEEEDEQLSSNEQVRYSIIFYFTLSKLTTHGA